ncbi:MAG TPA: SDR family NAD(P)-dependent oxidoreductase [Anaerolineae bacterium]|nr:SDR family NAD(P)-dependent oxidoreductase [Anaerolineae bacterium]HMR65106.1 SDR family NAD(P)-dependent oxidoreductase [Anaerolineae bacterium]
MTVSADDNRTRVVLVTGATGAIGQAIARQLAARDFKVVLGCRNPAKGERAVQDIRQATGNNRVRYALVDVSRKSEVQTLAASWPGPLHLLVNNAAVTPRSRQETPDGIELQFATNVLGYVWMVLAFEDRLKASAPSRVVNVASYWAGDLDLDDLEFKRRRYSNGQAYRQSKQANRMLTVALAERLKASGVTVNACHPGDVPSSLSHNLGFGGHQSPDQGAETPVWVATDPVGQERTGRYFEGGREVKDRFAQDQAAIEALYQRCLGY